MQFTVAPPGTPLRPPAPKPQPRLVRLGKVWRAYTRPGRYEPVKAVTADGEWLFARFDDGTWAAGHLPTTTQVKDGLRSLAACRAYAASAKAPADLERIQADAKAAAQAAGTEER